MLEIEQILERVKQAKAESLPREYDFSKPNTDIHHRPMCFIWDKIKKNRAFPVLLDEIDICLEDRRFHNEITRKFIVYLMSCSLIETESGFKGIPIQYSWIEKQPIGDKKRKETWDDKSLFQHLLANNYIERDNFFIIGKKPYIYRVNYTKFPLEISYKILKILLQESSNNLDSLLLWKKELDGEFYAELASDEIKALQSSYHLNESIGEFKFAPLLEDLLREGTLSNSYISSRFLKGRLELIEESLSNQSFNEPVKQVFHSDPTLFYKIKKIRSNSKTLHMILRTMEPDDLLEDDKLSWNVTTWSNWKALFKSQFNRGSLDSYEMKNYKEYQLKEIIIQLSDQQKVIPLSYHSEKGIWKVKKRVESSELLIDEDLLFNSIKYWLFSYERERESLINLSVRREIGGDRNGTLITTPPPIKKYTISEEILKNEDLTLLRYFHDISILEPESILHSTRFLLHSGEILVQVNDLSISYTGRVFPRGFNSTRLTREEKRINYEILQTLTDKPICNYDLKNSQMNCILSYADIFNLNYPNLRKYLIDDQRREISNLIGVSEQLLKGFLLRVIFGVRLDLHKTVPNSLKDLYTEYGYKSFESQMKIHNKIQDNWIVEGVLKDLLSWREDCKKVIKMMSADSLGLPDWYTNGVTTVRKSSLTSSSKISAFLLQGMESAFIYHLTKNQYSRIKGNDYGVISYEFDGIVTLGSITEESVISARLLSGFKYAQVELKPWIGKFRKFVEEELFQQILKEE